MTRFATREALEDDGGDDDESSDEDVSALATLSLGALAKADPLSSQEDDDNHNYSAGEEDAADMEL